MSTPKRSFRPRKRFGQHFLAAKWAERVVKTIDPQPGDVFLEIGPGEGALTFPLARTGAPILAVEVDRDLLAELAPRVPPNVSLLSGDILRTDVLPFLTGLQPQTPPGAVPGTPPPARRYRIVGNLPYNLSTPILFKMLEWHARTGLFYDATVMLQREVADRLAAKPGTKAWGALSLYLQLNTHINVPLRLPPGAFNPPPKVHSAIAHLIFQPRAVRVADQEVFDRLVRTMFSLRRKTLNNVLKAYDPAGPALLAIAKIDGMRRPETLSLAELAHLVELLAALKRPAVL
jgi:16S rRNA (adenine1518-N6/adenine1519-N6)-dimethyltransferase